MSQFDEICKIRETRYLKIKEKEKRLYYDTTIESLNYTKDVVNYIYDNKLIEKIQHFFLKYKLSNKICINIYDYYEYNDNDIIKIRIKNKVYGWHYLQWQKHFDFRGYSDIKFDLPIEINNLRRINKNIKCKSKFQYEIKNKYQDIQGFYINNYSYTWEFSDIYNLLETRGIQKLAVSQDMFNNLLSYDPGVYAIEIITPDSVNTNRAYCIFDDFPTLDNDISQLPIGVYNQLKITPNDNQFKIRIIKPDKGKQIKLKCFIDPSELFNDVKNQLTLELTKHKIVSLNQIICVESDLDHSIIPFLVTELYPNYVLDITDIDLEIAFEECFIFDNPIESLFLYFNS